MLTQLYNYFINTALKHRAVNSAKYQKRILTNAQNENRYIQFSFDDSPYFDLLISTTNQPFTFEMSVDILAFPKTDGTYSILDAQNDCFTVGIEWLAYIAKENYFLGQLALRDYSFIGLSNYTDDNAAGFRFTVQWIIPNPINLCTYMDNFSDEYIPTPEPEKEINVTDPNPPTEINDLVLRPILLPTKNNKP